MHNYFPSIKVQIAESLVSVLLNINDHIHGHLFGIKETISNDNDLAATLIDVKWYTC